MTAASAESLVALTETIRQLRAIPQVRERGPGRFELLGQPFATFDEDAGVVRALLRKAAGSGTDRFALDDPSLRRKFVDEAKRRATRFMDEA